MTSTITLADHAPAARGIPRRTAARRSGTRRPVSLLPWAVRGRIATTADETAFVADLTDRAARDGRRDAIGHRRSDVTALLNALRGGLTVDQLLGEAPGLQPQRLLDAHATLEAARRDSVAAWRAIVDAPTAEALAHHGPVAARLLPVVIDRLRRVAAMSPGALASEIARAHAAIDATDDRVRRIEGELDGTPAGTARHDELARVLFDQHGECVFAHDAHLPARVGSLLPTRVAALLGEQATPLPTAV